MLRDITLGQYYPVDSVLHRMDPRTKLFGTLVYIVTLFIADSIWAYGLAALFLAVSFLEQTTEYGITGLLCVLAVAAAWGAGRLKAGKHEKAQLDQMKAKDL